MNLDAATCIVSHHSINFTTLCLFPEKGEANESLIHIQYFMLYTAWFIEGNQYEPILMHFPADSPISLSLG